MGKFSCLSCSCFSSSTTHEQVTTVVLPTQASQQPSISGPSTTLLSSQAPNSTPSSSSQQLADVDLESFLQKFKDISRLQDLIQFIEELLKRVSGEKKEEGSSSATTSYIEDGQRFLELVDKHVGKLPQKHDSKDGPSAEIETVAINLLKGAAQIHWLGAALSVVGFVLARYNEMSNNQKECLQILKVLVDLGKHVVELTEEMPEQKQKLKDAVECIVEGCIMCASQLSTGKFVRFLTASVSADGLKGFQRKIDRLYQDLTLSTGINVQKRIPKLASQSKVAYNRAVGIESAQERVIKLLDLNAQHASSRVVVVYGIGGIGKTTLADAVYDCIDHHRYNKCRVHMDQHCTKRDLKTLQEQVLKDLFNQNVILRDSDQGRQKIWSASEKNREQPVFLYIDNGLREKDLKELLPVELGSCLPPRSRLLVTTRNLQETDIFLFWNVQRQQYLVDPLPETKAREILLKRARDYNDENKICDLLELCGGVPLLLELAGAQLAKNTENANFMALELLKTGERVEKQDISDRMVDYVYHSLLHPVREAFLDITSFLYSDPRLRLPRVNSSGEEEFRALEEASFIKRDEYGDITIHDIVQARGRKISEEEGNRITDPEVLLDFLKEEKKLKNLKSICFRGRNEKPPIEIKDSHLEFMSNSLRVLSYQDGSQITFSGRCHKPFQKLRCLQIPDYISELPMEFEKLENLAFYRGPFTQAMSFYELPPSLRSMFILTNVAENGVRDSKVAPRVTSLVDLSFMSSNMQWLPEGMEKLTKLESLCVFKCNQLRESKFGELRNLRRLVLYCKELKVLPSDFGRLSNLEYLRLTHYTEREQISSDIGQSSNLKYRCFQCNELSYSFGQFNNLKTLILSCFALNVLPSELGLPKCLECIDLTGCVRLKELPPDIGQLQNLRTLSLSYCSELKELPPDIGKLQNLERLDLSLCFGLKELPPEIGQLQNLELLDLSGCNGLKELPPGIGQLQNLEWLDLSGCTGLKELPSGIGQLQNLERLDLSRCTGLKELPPGIGQLQNLERLDLSRCTGLKELPPGIGQLHNLRTLSLSSCFGLQELPPDIGQLKNLKELELSDCDGLKELPSGLKDLIRGDCKVNYVIDEFF